MFLHKKHKLLYEYDMHLMFKIQHEVLKILAFNNNNKLSPNIQHEVCHVSKVNNNKSI